MRFKIETRNSEEFTGGAQSFTPLRPPLFLRKKGLTLVVRGFRWPVMDNLHFRYVRN